MPEVKVKEKEVKSAMANAIMKHETLIPYKPYSILDIGQTLFYEKLLT